MAERRRSARVGATALVLLVVLALGTSAGCGPDGATSVDQAAFEARLREREALDADEASCVGDYVFAGYDEAEIVAIHDDGVAELESDLWSEYVQAMIACTLTDQLPEGRHAPTNEGGTPR
jgi:hypothetical protein